MSQCNPPDCSHPDHQVVEKPIDTPTAQPVHVPTSQTFVDDRGRAVDPEEVRPVKPIDLNTPEQLLKKAEEKLKETEAREKVLEAKLAEAQTDAKLAVEIAAATNRDLQAQKKRSAEIAAERETWKGRATRAEAKPTPEHVVNIVAERDRLRQEVAAKDRRIAEADKRATADSLAVEQAKRIAAAAEQREGMVRGTIESMQIARDAAQKREAAAVKYSNELEEKLKKAEEDLRVEVALRVQREKNDKAKAAAQAAPVKKGA
jgi:colicin import membrane protein